MRCCIAAGVICMHLSGVVKDRQGFYVSELVKTEGKCIVIVVDQFGGGSILDESGVGDGVSQLREERWGVD